MKLPLAAYERFGSAIRLAIVVLHFAKNEFEFIWRLTALCGILPTEFIKRLVAL